MNTIEFLTFYTLFLHLLGFQNLSTIVSTTTYIYVVTRVCTIMLKRWQQRTTYLMRSDGKFTCIPLKAWLQLTDFLARCGNSNHFFEICANRCIVLVKFRINWPNLSISICIFGMKSNKSTIWYDNCLLWYLVSLNPFDEFSFLNKRSSWSIAFHFVS